MFHMVERFVMANMRRARPDHCEAEDCGNTVDVMTETVFTDDMTNTTCTGTRYPINADAPDEGTDIHHDGPCPVHLTEPHDVIGASSVCACGKNDTDPIHDVVQGRKATLTTTKTYLENMRDIAQSILAGVQRLEDLGATADDDHYSNAEHGLLEADTDLWALVDWISEGRIEG